MFDPKIAYWYVVDGTQFVARYDNEQAAIEHAKRTAGLEVRKSSDFKEWTLIVLYVREFITPCGRPIVRKDLEAIGFHENSIRIFEQFRNGEVSWWNSQLNPPANYR